MCLLENGKFSLYSHITKREYARGFNYKDRKLVLKTSKQQKTLIYFILGDGFCLGPSCLSCLIL